MPASPKGSDVVCRAKTPNITKKRQARQSMRPKQEAQSKRLRSSTAGSVRQLASPELEFSTEDCQGILDMNKPEAMEAISEEEDERILDLEAEIEELREQVQQYSQLKCNAV